MRGAFGGERMCIFLNVDGVDRSGLVNEECVVLWMCEVIGVIGVVWFGGVMGAL